MTKRMVMIVITHTLLITSIFTRFAIAEGFELIGSIPSNNGLYYTTMAPQGDFIAMGDQRSPGAGIDIIYAGDPANMILVGNVQTSHMTYQLAWSGSFVYAPASWDGFFIYDVSDFNNIFLVSDTSFGESLTSVAIRDDIALVGGTDHMYSINIENPGNPHVVWSTGNFGCSDMALGDSIAYTYRTNEYVVIMDISSPENPHEITSFAYQGVNGIEIDQSERYLYLTAGHEGLVIYNVENPGAPMFLSSTPMPNGAWCIDLCQGGKYQNIVFVSGYTGGLWAVDVSNPMNPIPLDNYNSSLWSCYVISEHDIVFHTIADSMLSLRFERATGFRDENNYSRVEGFSLWQNYPNPFNASTTIRFILPEPQSVKLTIYDLLGRQVTILIDEYRQSGIHIVTFDTSGRSSGIYFYRLQAGEKVETKRMMLLK